MNKSSVAQGYETEAWSLRLLVQAPLILFLIFNL